MDRIKEKKSDDILEKLVHINRITKVVKGGRRFGFSALVVVGNQNGKIGIALSLIHISEPLSLIHISEPTRPY